MRRFRFWPTVIKVIMILLIIVVAYLVYHSVQEKGDEHEQSMVGRFHNIGDAMGGMTAPLIGLISALLVYLSFQAQIEANRLTSEIRNDETLKENLNDFLNRIKDKFKSIIQSIGSEKRFNELFLSPR